MNNEQLNNGVNLFESETTVTVLGGAHQLNKTARLTQQATEIAQSILKEIMSNVAEYELKVKASQQSHDAMDDLINEVHSLGEEPIDYLKTVSEDEIEKMIRSQQSKRSRAKSKVMTQENYLTMMVGAISENLLRIAGNKPKSAGGGTVMGEIGFSAEDLEQLAQYPEELKKAIRNVQSKKSIMKAKQGFDIQDPRWQQLLRAEQQLKDVRDQTNIMATQEAKDALEAKSKVEEMLSTTDVGELKADEARALLDQVKEMLASK